MNSGAPDLPVRPRPGERPLGAWHERVGAADLDETSVVARVARYSSLRGVERALLPSVRSRVRLPTTRIGADLLVRLQALVETSRGGQPGGGDPAGHARREFARVDEALDAFAAALVELIDETPIAQLRSTLPPLLERSRGEIVALLDLCLDSSTATSDATPPFKIDYLITLLSQQKIGRVSMLRSDPCSVSPGVRARCALQTRRADDGTEQSSRLFRDAQIELLSAEELDGIVGRMRDVKARLGATFFDTDVLRAVVSYNIAADNRFRELFDLEHTKDAAIERSLRALTELDNAIPDPARTASGDDASSALSSPGMRALEEALRDRLAGRPHDEDLARRLAASIEAATLDAAGATPAPQIEGDLGDTLSRAAAVVGLALRDLPSLTARLRELDIDVSRVKTSWIRELDEALQAAITALAKSGRAERAAHLSRTRMRYLSSH